MNLLALLLWGTTNPFSPNIAGGPLTWSATKTHLTNKDAGGLCSLTTFDGFRSLSTFVWHSVYLDPRSHKNTRRIAGPGASHEQASWHRRCWRLSLRIDRPPAACGGNRQVGG